MPLYETESLVLKSYSLAEADRIVVFFTRDNGMVRGVAKGAKRLQSRFGSTLEPFSIVHLEYFQKEDRELVSIQRVDMLRSCFGSASDPGFLQTFSYIADLLTAFVPPQDPNETLYRMVKACLEAADSSPETLLAIRLYFEVWLLRLGGYLPDWSACAICKRSLGTEESVDLQADFQLFCPECRRSRGNHVITGPHREVFHMAQKLDPRQFATYALEKTDLVAEVSGVLKQIVSNIIGREVATETSFAVNF
jgi:DNA repair protein RecO (recombination protein O)